MATRDEIIRILLQADGEQDVAKLRGAIEKLGDVSDETKAQLQGMVDALAGNNRQQAAIAAYQALEERLVATATRAAQARVEFDRLGAEFTEAAEPSAKLAADFQRASDALTRLEAEQRKLGQQLRIAGSDLKAAGVDTGRLAQEQERLRAASTRTEAEIRKLAAATQQGTNRFQGFFAALNQSRAALLGATVAFAGISRAFAGAARASSEFQTSVAEIGTLLRDQSGIPQITEDLKALAREYGGPVTAQAKALYQIISAGAAEGAQANAILAASNQLAIGGLTQLETAADGLTSVLNAYNLGAEQATRVSDLFFTAVRDGKTTVDDLSNTLGRVAPLASEAGLGLEELLAAIAALTKTGASTEQAVTAIRGALTSIVKPTTEAQKLAADLGVQFDVAALQAKGFAGFLNDVSAATGGNQAQLARLFGSVEGLNGVLALTGSQAEGFAASLQNMADSAGAAQRAFELIDDTPAQRLARFRAATDQLKIGFGDLLTAATPLVEGLTSVLNSVNSLPVPVKLAGAAVVAFTAVLGPLALAVRALGPAVAALAGALPGLGAAAAAAVGSVNGLAAAAGRLAAIFAAGFAVERVAAAYRAVSDLVDINRQVLALERELELVRANQASRIERIRNEYQGVADLVIRQRDELDSLNRLQLEGYGIRLQEAARYWRAIEIEAKRAGDSAQQAFARDRATQYAAAIDTVRDALRGLAGDATVAESNLDSAFETLGVSAELAGRTITATGQKILDAFGEVAQAGQTTGDQVAASFTGALAKVSTSAEVRALGDVLLQAFLRGKIGADEFGAAVEAAEARIRALKGGAQQVGQELGNAGQQGNDLSNSVQQVSQNLQGATKGGVALTNASKKASEATQDAAAAAAKLEQSVQAAGQQGQTAGESLYGAMRLARAEFEATSEAAAKLFDSNLFDASELGRTYDDFLRAIETAQEATRRAIEQEKILLDTQINGWQNLTEARARYLIESRGGAEALDRAAQNVERNFKLLGEQDLGRLRSALSAAAGQLRQIENEANSALASLEALNREEEKAALRRAGDERRLQELEFQERLREIDRLAETAGARGRQQAEEARRRARENHEADLREIAERARAEKQAAKDVENERRRERRESGGGAAPAGVGGGMGGQGGGQNVTINVAGLRPFQVGVRSAQDADTLRQFITALTQAARNSGLGGSIGL